MSAGTLDRVKAILVTHLGPPAEGATPETRMSAMGADSLDVVEIEMFAEDTFGFRFGDAGGFGSDPTIAEVVALIDERVAAGREQVAL